MSCVLDSSVTLAWIYIDEADALALRLSETIHATGAWVPTIWRLEIANSLQMNVRRGRISAPFRDAALIDLSLLNVTVDTETDAHAWTATLQLAIAHQLTLYDASYLELARRRALPLATLDSDLRRAADALGIELFRA